MRTRRILGEGPSCYHVMSRVVDRRFIFEEAEKERFRILMRRLERFSGVEILTYSIMSNHFHLLIRVPMPINLSDSDLKKRLESIYSAYQVAEIMRRIEGFRAEGRDDLAESARWSYLDRMYSLACFLKELKQRFTQDYNRRHDRHGTLWEERYKSVLIESGSGALIATAAYIDLNAVRAGICEDPEFYRYCGYGEAIGGGAKAGWGLRWIVSAGVNGIDPSRLLAVYRSYLLRDPDCSTKDLVAAGIESGVPLSHLLRSRVRYFSEGAVMGSRRFVDEMCNRWQDRLGRKRPAKARPMRGGDWDGLCVLKVPRTEKLAS